MHQTEVRFEGVPSSVSAARHLVSEVLAAAGAPDDSWSAVQIVSELATNAVVHAATPFVVRLTVAESVVRIAVTDERPASPATKRRFSSDTTTGRGLRLVETLSRDWGVDAAASSKTVWCEIVRLRTGATAATAAMTTSWRMATHRRSVTPKSFLSLRRQPPPRAGPKRS